MSQVKPGIFANYRSKGIYASNENYFQINEPASFKKNSVFCSTSAASSGSAKNMFDGNVNTCFATEDLDNEDHKNFSIKFKKNPITMYGYSMYTICYPHSEVVVEGSNNGKDWTEIDHITKTISKNLYNYYVCSNPGTYHIIRFTMFGKNTGNSYRIHLGELEIYGKIKRAFSCEIRRNRFNHFPLMFIFLVAS